MSKEKQIIEIKECIDAVYGADCAYFDVDGFAIANEIYNAGYRKQSEVVGEIISLIELRMAKNKENRKGVQSEVWQSIFEGREDAYKDIKEIIEQKYRAKMKGGAE